MIYIILILGLVFRLFSLNQSLWLDEATTALVSKMPIADFFGKFMPADFHPPLYYIIVHYWSLLFGTSEISLRLPSVIFGILTIYVVYLIAKEVKMKWPYLAALYLATSGLHIYYSQEARMYALAALLVSFLVLSFIKQKWVYFSLLLPLIFLTDYVSIIIFPVLLIFTFVKKRDDLKKFLISCIPLAISFLVWLPTLIRQLSAGLSVKSSAWWNILGQVTFKNIALIPTKFMIGRITTDNKIIYGLAIVFISAIFAVIIGRAKNKKNLGIIWAWLLISLVLGIILSFYIPTLTYFRYLFILPAFYILLSDSTNKFFIAIILFVNLSSSILYLSNSKYQREDWRKLSNAIGEEKIILPASSQRESLIYYGKEKNIITESELKNNSYKTVWLSRYVWDVFDKDDSTRKYIENLGYNWSEELDANGVIVWKYIKN
jgi:4-amino-4-deoxy-L-arabinose transferase-like glycosyltransferase